MPCLRHISFIGRSVFASFKAEIIWISVNRDFFIGPLILANCARFLPRSGLPSGEAYAVSDKNKHYN